MNILLNKLHKIDCAISKGGTVCDCGNESYNEGCKDQSISIYTWLYGRCAKHGYKHELNHVMQERINGLWYAYHRRDCPKCWPEFESEVLSKWKM